MCVCVYARVLLRVRIYLHVCSLRETDRQTDRTFVCLNMYFKCLVFTCAYLCACAHTYVCMYVCMYAVVVVVLYYFSL